MRIKNSPAERAQTGSSLLRSGQSSEPPFVPLRALSLPCLVLTLAGLVSAASPVGKITVSGRFRLSGVVVDADGVPNWPVVAGDEIVMQTGIGEITFDDGTRVLLMPKSRVSLSVRNRRTLLRVEEGAIAYRFAKNSTLDIAALSRKAIAHDESIGRLLAAGDDVYWNTGRNYFWIDAENRIHRAVESETEFIQQRLTPYTLGNADAVRQYDPEWGYVPGASGPPSPIPPPAVVEPEQPPPISPWRPGGRTQP